MSLDQSARHEAFVRAEIGMDVAVLKEQMKTVNNNLADMKTVNTEQTKILTDIRAQMNQANGGFRAVMWVGGAVAACSTVVLGWVTLFIHRNP